MFAIDDVVHVVEYEEATGHGTRTRRSRGRPASQASCRDRGARDRMAARLSAERLRLSAERLPCEAERLPCEEVSRRNAPPLEIAPSPLKPFIGVVDRPDHWLTSVLVRGETAAADERAEARAEIENPIGRDQPAEDVNEGCLLERNGHTLGRDCRDIITNRALRAQSCFRGRASQRSGIRECAASTSSGHSRHGHARRHAPGLGLARCMTARGRSG
jgi:hypothetical protein